MSGAVKSITTGILPNALTGSPEMPVIEPRKELPEADEDKMLLRKRREAAKMINKSGVVSTQVSQRESKPLGQ